MINPIYFDENSDRYENEEITQGMENLFKNE